MPGHPPERDMQATIEISQEEIDEAFRAAALEKIRAIAKDWATEWVRRQQVIEALNVAGAAVIERLASEAVADLPFLKQMMAEELQKQAKRQMNAAMKMAQKAEGSQE